MKALLKDTKINQNGLASHISSRIKPNIMKNGFALDPRLKQYIKDNFFLSPDILDYDKIECVFTKREINEKRY